MFVKPKLVLAVLKVRPGRMTVDDIAKALGIDATIVDNRNAVICAASRLEHKDHVVVTYADRTTYWEYEHPPEPTLSGRDWYSAPPQEVPRA